MNALTRWDPFRELEDMQQRLSSVLGRRPQRRDGGQGIDHPRRMVAIG